MTSRNDHTGDLQQTKAPSSTLIKNLQESGQLMSVTTRRENKGKYKFDPDVNKFIPVEDWNKKYYKPPIKRLPKPIVKGFEPYQSPVSDRIITTPQQKDRDMKEHGCRQYEGRHDEQVEVDRANAYKEEKLWENVGETINQTAHDIEHGHKQVEEHPDPVKPVQTWDFADG